MFHSLMRGINIKSLLMAMLAMFVFIFVSDFVIHGMLLADWYKETANLWRSESEMQSYMLWMLAGQFLIAKFFTVIFAKGYEGQGWKEGLRYGILMGPLFAAGYFIQYATTPLPIGLLWAWVLAALFQAEVGGIVVASIYKK